MKTIHVYQVVSNSDTTEWRGRPVILGNFTKEAIAKQAAVWQWVMGTMAEVSKSIIYIFDSLDEYMETTWNIPSDIKENSKKTALAKLTPLEKRSLWI